MWLSLDGRGSLLTGVAVLTGVCVDRCDYVMRGSVLTAGEYSDSWGCLLTGVGV